MKKLTLLATVLSIVTLMASCGNQADNKEVNHNYMWFDCEANYATLSHPDSIRFYLGKC